MPRFTHRLLIAAGIAGSAALIAAPAAADHHLPGEAAPLIERHANTPPGLILQAVTVRPGATMLYLSGQLASPIDPAATAARQPGEITVADFGDTRTQTISTLEKIETILAAHGYAMSDVIKMTAFVAGDPALGGRMDFAGFNAGFRDYFGTEENPNTLARSTVQVAALVAPYFLVELEVVAAK